MPTEVVAADAQERLDIDRERISVIPEAAAAAMHPRGEEEIAAVRERYGLPEPYLLWVGGMLHPERRKRVAELAQAPRRMPLVLAGPTRPWAHELPNVTLTGQVSDDELAAIYSGAHALVFPSEDEGFGLPTVEALACGTPVVACEAAGAARGARPARDLRRVGRHRGPARGRRRARSGPRRRRPPGAGTDAARATWSTYAAAAAAHPHSASTRRVPRLPRGAF